MKALLIPVVMVLICSSAFAADAKITLTSKGGSDSKTALESGNSSDCKGVQISATSEGITGGQGCCSHHGGECGCAGGRDMCCDGTLSPSCGCYKPDPPKFGQ